jgi:hypothetical protein
MEDDMKQTMQQVKRAVIGAFFMVAAASTGMAACSGNTGSGGQGGDAPTGTGGSAATTGSSGTSGCLSPSDCDDVHGCTIDTCSAGSCFHTVGPNSGNTACPTGMFCTLDQGCIAAPACASTADCKAIWNGDVCKTQIACDLPTSLCTFVPLDKDGDGHPPQVCGGDDCDDNDPDRFPGNPEVCDGKDNNCDGVIDNGLDACGGAHCVDKMTDPQNCGTCGNTCPSGPEGYCSNGTCACLTLPNICGASCVDLTSDNNNCGACGKGCAPSQTCESSTCKCPSGDLCGMACVDKMTDPQNCGTCGKTCTQGASCLAGTCGPCPPGTPNTCNNACVNLTNDVKNCGVCGKACAADENCTAGKCIQCPLNAPTPCNGSCSDFNTDSNNCGSCGGMPCDTANYEVCSGGMCAGAATCAPCDGTTDCCFECPTNIQTDTANCGSCGKFCNTGDVCSGGLCKACQLFDTCKSCCDKQHSDGFWIHGKALYPGCACAAGAPCAAACQDPAANVCQDLALSPTSQCVACLRQQWSAGAACAGPAIQACAADPLCSAVTSCFATCP